jgi:hypothetical protein
VLTLHMFCVCRWTMHLQSDAEQQNDTARKSAVALMAAAAYRRPLQVAQIFTRVSCSQAGSSWLLVLDCLGVLSRCAQ